MLEELPYRYAGLSWKELQKLPQLKDKLPEDAADIPVFEGQPFAEIPIGNEKYRIVPVRLGAYEDMSFTEVKRMRPELDFPDIKIAPTESLREIEDKSPYLITIDSLHYILNEHGKLTLWNVKTNHLRADHMFSRQTYHFLLPPYDLSKDFKGLFHDGLHFLNVSAGRFDYCMKFFLLTEYGGRLFESAETRASTELVGVSEQMKNNFWKLVQEEPEAGCVTDVRFANLGANISKMLYVAAGGKIEEINNFTSLAMCREYLLHTAIRREREALKELEKSPHRRQILLRKRIATKLFAAENALLNINSVEVMIAGYNRFWLRSDNIDASKLLVYLMLNEDIFSSIIKRRHEQGIGMRRDKFLQHYLGEEDKALLFIEMAGESCKAALPMSPVTAIGDLVPLVDKDGKDRLAKLFATRREKAMNIWLVPRVNKIAACLREISRIEELAISMTRRICAAYDCNMPDTPLVGPYTNRQERIIAFAAECLNTFNSAEEAARRYVSISASSADIFTGAGTNMARCFNSLHHMTKCLRLLINPGEGNDRAYHHNTSPTEAANNLVSLRKLLRLVATTKRGLPHAIAEMEHEWKRGLARGGQRKVIEAEAALL